MVETFEELRGALDRIGDIDEPAEIPEATIVEAVAVLRTLPEVTRDALAALVRENPERIRAFGLAVGIQQEQLGIRLRQVTGSRSFRKARDYADLVVNDLDQLGLVDRIRNDLARSFTYEDVLQARYGSRGTAGRAIRRGRRLEDMVEAVVLGLGLPHVMRTRYVGRGGQTAPCDLAIPSGGRDAQIVVGIKGFNSTGSKLTDARSEIEGMAFVRLPSQFVLAVVDGLGWLDRQADLRKICSLLTDRQIDGLYTQATLNRFRDDIQRAAELRGIAPIPIGPT